MSENVNVETVKKPSQLLNEEFKSLLDASSGKVKERVLEAKVEQEIASRVELITKALAELKTKNQELSKLSNKPDREEFNASGESILKSWSKESLENMKKLRERIEKLETALEKAMNENKYEDLKNLKV